MSLKQKVIIKIVKKQLFILGIWTLGAIAGASIINWYYLIPKLQMETEYVQGDWSNGNAGQENNSSVSEDSDTGLTLVENPTKENTEGQLDHSDSSSQSAIATTYNAEEAQTDSDPLTMASGKRVYEGAIASNCHPLGTKLKIEGEVYTVDDRMNSRYTKDCGTVNERLDIFKWNKSDNFKKQVQYAKL